MDDAQIHLMAFGAGKKDMNLDNTIDGNVWIADGLRKEFYWFITSYVMAICCFKERRPPSRHSDVDDTNLETPELSAINLCRRYVRAQRCNEKALN